MIQKSPTILVVDDDLDTLDLLKLELERAKYTVLTASSWKEVTERLEYMSDQKQAINVIILDLMMPVRSGFDVLQSLHVMMDPIPPVIVLSALTSLDDYVKARELGAMKYLNKPTSRQTLMEAVKEAMKTGIRSTWRDMTTWRKKGWEKGL
jgi:DNA-binding response OmpR family regulator